jgi:PAS domain-containing protein
MRNVRLEQRLQGLLADRGSEAALVVDDDGRVLLMNQGARALAGVDLERVFRQRDPAIDRFRARLRVGWRATCETRLQGEDGVTRWLSLDGRAFGEVGVVTLRDVTGRRPA